MEKKELIEMLEELKLKYERIRGFQKFGIGVHFWDGRVQGIKDVIELINTLLTSSIK